TVVGYFFAGGQQHGFMCTLSLSLICSNYVQVDVSIGGVLQNSTAVRGVNTKGQIVGHFIAPSTTANHGFFCQLPLASSCFTQLDVQNSQQTQILAINDSTQITGDFVGTIDSVLHGFVASIDSDGDTLLDNVDNCPTDFNPDQADRNGNGVGD